MDDSYLIVYEDAFICEKLRDVIRLYQTCDMRRLIFAWNDVASQISDLCDRISRENVALANKVMDAAYLIHENFNSREYAIGVIEGRLIPLVHDHLARYESIDVDDGIWRIKGTPSGFVTLEDIERCTYLHSTFDPMNEAYQLASVLYEPGMTDFYFFGCGLGYLPYQMWRISEESLCVHIYDPDASLIQYAQMFGPLGLIEDKKLDIHNTEDVAGLFDEYVRLSGREQDRHIYFLPWIQDRLLELGDNRVDEWLPQYRFRFISGRRLTINKTMNLNLPHGTLDDFPSELKREEWVVLAAGPSFDENIDFIRESIGKKTVIAVSTVIPRLYRDRIKPDVVIVCDPYKTIVPHIQGYEDMFSDVVLIAHDQTYWKFTDLYPGPIYLIGEKEQWDAAGTVASVALEAACRLGARKVFAVGMDLAYPGGVHYASGAAQTDNPDVNALPLVRSNDGGMVYTAENFKYYGAQIEEQIAAHPDVEIWNMSKHGMYIKGMKAGYSEGK